jgi:hypothetical protein
MLNVHLTSNKETAMSSPRAIIIVAARAGLKRAGIGRGSREGRHLRRSGKLVAASVIGLLLVLVANVPAFAAVSIIRAELSGSNLRVEGQGATPNNRVTVNAGQASALADSSGAFRIESSTFPKPPDCRVVVSDGTTSSTATLSGCTVSRAVATLAGVTVSPTDVVGGNSATGTVTLSSPAPTGGFVIDLSSDNTAAATAPASVTVPAGSSSATFVVSTKQVNAQSADIIGTVGGDFSTEKYAIITVWDAFHFSHGSISIVPGGNGSGRITSQPAGIDCSIVLGNGSGACSVFFPVGTVVALGARPAANSSFQGWRGLPGCFDASKVKIARGTNINCQPGFALK